MDVREVLVRAMHLQLQYSDRPTDAMRLRGTIIKQELPELLNEYSERISFSSAIDASDLLIEGGDGIGRRALVPWVRIASKQRSPKATVGWYVVWLLKEDGSGVYLALAHASTENVDGDFVKRTASETRQLVSWAKEVLSSAPLSDPPMLSSISLGRGSLARAYERTTAAAYYFSSDDMPSADDLWLRMDSMLRMLSLIYAAEPAQKRSGETSTLVIEAVSAIDEAISGRPRAMQGIGLTAPERRAVELRAMEVAIEHFIREGFAVEDTSSRRPYDLAITKDGEVHFIEVKGTTGGLGDIVLTKNEVEHHRQNHPKNGLFIVHSVTLHRDGSHPHARDGIPYVQMPWLISTEHLNPIAYRYRVT